MARTPSKATKVIDMDTAAQQALETETTETNQQLANLQVAYTTEQRQLSALINQRIGRGQAYTMIGKLVTVADLIDLKQIKESKAYKGFEHIGNDGQLATVATWEDYCRLVEGRPVRSVDTDLENFEALGEELFEAMRQVGLGPAKMRSLRKLPDDHKTALIEAAQTGDKDTFVELAEEFISKNAKEKAELQLQLEDTKAELVAKEEVAATNRRKIDELQEELVKVKKLPPDECAAQMRKEANEYVDTVDDLIRVQLTDALTAVQNYSVEHGIDPMDYLEGRVNLLEKSLGYLRRQIDIVRMETSTEPPIWETWDAEAE